MKASYTTAELGVLRDKSERTILLQAKREGWVAQSKGSGKNHRTKYWATSSMPATSTALAAIRKAEAEALAAEIESAEGDKPLAPYQAQPLASWQSEIRDARLAILAEVVRMVPAHKGAILAAERRFAELAASGELPERMQTVVNTANARKGKARALSAATLRLWRTKREKEGPDSLAPKAPEKKAEYPVWLPTIFKFYRRPTKPSIAWCYEQVAGSGVQLPSLTTVERTIARLPRVDSQRGRMGPRDIRNILAYCKRTFDDLLPGDVWSADGHKADMECAHPIHGQPIRPEIVTVIDIATRRVVGWSAEQHENALLVADSIRHAVQHHGIPAIYYVDNGCGFKNHVLDGPAAGMMARLGIRKEHSLPYRSQARGVIEKLNDTLWVREARGLVNYVGHDMDKEARQIVFKKVRKDLRDKGECKMLPSWQDFMGWATHMVAAYNARPHTSLPKILDADTGKRRHLSPDEMWQRHVAEADIPQLTPYELDDCFRPYVERSVRRCIVKLFGNEYFSTELEAFHERRVQVGYDVHDPQRVWVRDEDGRLVCTAELNGHAAPYFPKSVVEQARERRAQGALTRLQRKEAEHLQVLESGAPPAPKPLTQREQAVVATLTTSESEAVPVFQVPNGDRERYQKWCDIDAQLSAGQDVEPKAAEWHGYYQQTTEFRSWNGIFGNAQAAAQ